MLTPHTEEKEKISMPLRNIKNEEGNRSGKGERFRLSVAQLTFVRLGADHELRLDEGIKLLLSEGIQLEGRLLERETLLVGILSNLASHVIANLGVEAGDKHERFLHDTGNLLLVSLKTFNEVLLKRAHAIGKNPRAVKEVPDHEGLVDVEFELAVHATNSGGNMVTHDLGADHGKSLALSGVDLARHDAAAGLVLGENEFAKAATGTTAEVADVLGNLGENSGESVETAVSLYNSIMGGEDLELVRRSLELGAGHLSDLLGNGLGKALKGVDAGADGGTTLSEEPEVRKAGLDALDARVELGDVAGEFLGEGQGGGVLEMSTANLDNVLSLEVVNLLLERIAEGLQGGDEITLKLEDTGDVHDSGEGIVGGGATVDVVVRVDRLLAAHLTPEDLDSTVGYDFIGVHVGLCARAGLPDDEREVVGELALGNLSRGLLDGLSYLGVKAITHVDGRRSALEDTERLDDGERHAVLGLVDAKVLERALSLGTPVLVRRDLDLAKGVALSSGGGHLQCGLVKASSGGPVGGRESRR